MKDAICSNFTLNLNTFKDYFHRADLAIALISIDATCKHFKPWRVEGSRVRTVGSILSYVTGAMTPLQGQTEHYISSVILLNYGEMHIVENIQNSGELQSLRENFSSFRRIITFSDLLFVVSFSLIIRVAKGQ